MCWRSDGRNVAGWRYVSSGSSGGSLYAREGSSDSSIRAKVERLDRSRLTGSAVWQSKAELYLADPQAAAQRERLAQELGVDVWSLAALSVGWKPGAYSGLGAWSYPQRTATGEIVSVGLRVDTADKKRRQRFDSDGGRSKSPPALIFIPGRWLTASGPVVMVEGMSDTAAIDSLRLDVVGHPGHTPGGTILDELEALLRAVPADREVIRMADREEEGTVGIDGARKTAQALATRLGRRIGVALAPDQAKDSRAWVRERWLAGPVSPARRDELRETFVSGILGAVEWIEPQERTGEEDVPVEPLAEEGAEIEIDQYRERMRADLEEWASRGEVRGRIAVLSAPAGAGKTTAVDDLVLPYFGTFVNALPTHENCRERRSALAQLPILDPEDVAAFPKLDETTCESFTIDQAEALRANGHRRAVPAERAQRLGFGVRATACRACPLSPWKETGKTAAPDPDLEAFSDAAVFGGAAEPAVETADADPFGHIRCRYWREVERAKAARGKLATLERVCRTGKTIVGKDDGRSILILDERGFETLAPTAAVSVDLLELLDEGLQGAALRIETDSQRDTPKTKTGARRDARVAGLGILDSEDDRRRRQESSEREERARKREQGSTDRQEDQIEHLRQLAAVAGEIARRLRDGAAAERWGVEVVPIEREVRRRKSGRLSKDEERRVDAALEEIVGSTVAEDEDKPKPRVPLVVRGRIVKQPARLLADALERSLPRDAVIDGKALELVRRIHAGRVDLLALHVDPLDGDDAARTAEGARRVKLTAIGTWETELPKEADVLVLDGTLDVAGLSKRLGRPKRLRRSSRIWRPIDSIGPKVRIRRQSPAVQLPADISKGTSVSRVAKTLEQALAAIPGAKRVGLIMISDHRKALFPRDKNGNDIRTKRSRELVPDHVLRRLARDADGRILIEHYSGGRDRSSNVWIQEADALILLGTPRPSAEAVVGELVRRLDVEALERGSAWGRRDWEARTVDGLVVRCHGRGYLDPDWAAAADSVTRVSLRQALERARTLLAGAEEPGGRPGGIPVVLVSSEGGLGIPVVETLPDAVSRGARRVEEIVRRVVEGSGPVEAVRLVPGENPGSLGDPESIPEGSPTCATTPTRRHPLLVENVAQVDPDHIRAAPEGSDGPGDALGAPSRAVFDELVRTGVDGKRVAERTVRLWIAEALAAGLVTKSGSTRATVYGLPLPVGIPDGVEEAETPIVGPATVPIPDADPVPDWELDDPDFGFPPIPIPVAPGTGPTWSGTWSPTGPSDYGSTWELVPTGPAAA